MAEGWKRARDAARATQPKWWTSGNEGTRWWLQVGFDDPVLGEVGCVMGMGNWYARARGNSLGIFESCRAAKLAVRRAVRR